jgi:Fe-S cluster assembly ATPase SufC
MLEKIELRSFKSFDQESVPLAPLTILVGANASGKSNLLDAIRYLQGIGLGMSLGEILHGRWEAGRKVWPGVRNGAEPLRWGCKSFSLTSHWSLDCGKVTHSLSIDSTGRLCAERLERSGLKGYLFYTHAAALRGRSGLQAGSAINVALKRAGKGNSPTATYDAARPLLLQIRDVPPSDPLHPAVRETIAQLAQALRAVTFLEIRPSRMRGYAPVQIKDLGVDGANVSSVLLELCSDDEEKKLELVEWLQELCAPEIEDIDFAWTDLKDEVMVVLVESSGSRVPARSLSGGTLRFLGELVAMKTAPPGSVLLIEEIENGLHPQRIRLLVQAMQSFARTKQAQIIATTHSPIVLEALSRDDLANVLLFARIPGAREKTVVRRLGELPHFQEVLERRGIEHLFTTGWLERAI